MANEAGRARAMRPEDISRRFVECANAGDVDGLVALYEPEAVLAFPPGSTTTGAEEIRAVFARFLADHPVLTAGEQRPTIVSGDLAVTSTAIAGGGITVEVARRQPDGAWLWVIDRFNILE